ncbi:unnamed protein product, partial [Polarella glacialis]
SAPQGNRSGMGSPLQVVPGNMIGELSIFLDKPLPLVYRCGSRCRFAALPRDSVVQLLDMQPRTCCLRILHIVTAKLAPWLHRVDAALDWIRIEGGRSLYHKGDPMRGFFVVLSGRLLVLE